MLFRISKLPGQFFILTSINRKVYVNFSRTFGFSIRVNSSQPTLHRVCKYKIRSSNCNALFVESDYVNDYHIHKNGIYISVYHINYAGYLGITRGKKLDNICYISNWLSKSTWLAQLTVEIKFIFVSFQLLAWFTLFTVMVIIIIIVILIT